MMGVIVLLGMAKTCNDYLAREKSGPYTRDSCRYDAMKKLFPMHTILTSNGDTEADDVAADSKVHIRAYWSRVGARTFKDAYTQIFTQPQVSSATVAVPAIDYIIMDYNRMPPQFISSSVFQFLTELHKYNIVNDDTVIVLPNRDHLTKDINRRIFHCEYIEAILNPLFVATSKIADKTQLCGYDNDEQVKFIVNQIDAKHNKRPFVALTFK
jgi:hypothetical protein